MSEYPSLLLVFIAGLLSFFSPCVLPLIPSFLSVLGGVSANRRRSVLLISTLCFILGFTVVFICLSIIVSATFLLMGGVSKYIQIIAGIIVIVMGLNIIFDFISILNYEKRLHLTNKVNDHGFIYGLVRAFITGAAFGAGWTPCIGPILASVLLLAGQSGKIGLTIIYLVIYSFGLGLPFFLSAAFFDRFLVSANWFRSNMMIIKIISGIFLVFIGVLILTGRFSDLNIAIQKWQYQYIDWAVDKALPFQLIGSWLNWLQSI